MSLNEGPQKKDKKEKKSHHRHHHHHGDDHSRKSTKVKAPLDATVQTPVVPVVVITPIQAVSIADDLKTRALTAVKALEETKEKAAHLDPQHSATIDKLWAHDPHAATALKLFQHANNETPGLEVKESEGQNKLHLQAGQLLPEHRDMVLDDMTKQWRIRTTAEQMAFEEEQKKAGSAIKLKKQ